MLDSALDCIVCIDAEGRVIEFNPAAQRVFGYTAEEAIGKRMGDLIVPPAIREAHEARLSSLVAGGEPQILDQRIELTGMRSDGSELPVELTMTRIADTDPPEFTGYLRDISDRVAAIEEQRTLRRNLVIASDAARRQLVRDLHDGAQQRLIAVAMNLQLIRAQLDDKQTEVDAELVSASEELLAAVDELRELARGIHPQILSEHGLEAALEVMARRSPIPVHVTYEAPRVAMLAESTAWFLISEALANANKHSQASRIDISVKFEDDQLKVSFVDDGIGLRGLPAGNGLSGMSDRARGIGGKTRIYSEPGQGTRLEAYLPCES